jgi:hypothetical protein
MDYDEKQKLRGKMLSTVANMRHEMLKAAVDKLPDEEPSEDTTVPKPTRKRRTAGK